MTTYDPTIKSVSDMTSLARWDKQNQKQFDLENASLNNNDSQMSVDTASFVHDIGIEREVTLREAATTS